MKKHDRVNAIQMWRSTGMPRKRARRSFSRIAIMGRPNAERKMNAMAPPTSAKKNNTKKKKLLAVEGRWSLKAPKSIGWREKPRKPSSPPVNELHWKAM